MQHTIDATRVQVRWLIRRDMDDVLAIENESFTNPWTEEEFICCLRVRNCIGVVAEIDRQVVGYMIYELHKDMLTISTFAVDPAFRRNGIGRAMIDRMKDKLSNQRRRWLYAKVRETNLDAQLFFAEMGFWAIDVIRKPYTTSPEDAILFRFEVSE